MGSKRKVKKRAIQYFSFRPLPQTLDDIEIITNHLKTMFPRATRSGAILYALAEVASKIRRIK